MRTVERDEFAGPIRHATRPDGTPIAEITTVGSWFPYWEERADQGLLRPEMHVISAEPPYLDPPRTNGARGLKIFKQFARHHAGYYRRFQVPPGTQLVTARAEGHAWYTQRHNARASEYHDEAGNWHRIHNGQPGLDMFVGLDPTGGTDPWASTVVWSYGRIYDAHDWISVTVGLPSETVTVFLRSRPDYGFAHADVYWAAVEVDAIVMAGHADPVDYVAVANLLPQDTTADELRYVLDVLHAPRESIVYSADDAGRLVAPALPGSFVRVWAVDRHPEGIARYLYDYGVEDIRYAEFDEGPGTPVPLEPGELRFTYPSTYLPPVITSPYGPRGAIFHYGVDLRSSWRAWGTEVLAAIDGEVILAGIEPGREYFGYQVQVRAQHGSDTVVARYAHLVPTDRGGIYVRAGDRVRRGDKLGRPDNTGTSYGDHLHFDVRVNGSYINPTELIDWPASEPPKPPTPVPSEPQFPPLPSNNLIGLHSGYPKAGWVEYHRDARPTLGKFFELGQCVDAKRLNPQSLIIYRRHVHNDGEWVNVADKRASAEAFLDGYSLHIQTHARNAGMTEAEVLAHVDVIESVNEVIGTNSPQIFAAVEFDDCFGDAVKRRYGDELHAGFLTVAIGNPGEHEVVHLLPAARKAYEDGHYLGYHAYWTGNRLRPSPSYLERHWPYHAGRWQEWDRVFRAHGVYPRYYLGESGIVFARDDAGTNFDSGRGWRSCGPFSYYIEQIGIFNQRLRAWNAQHGNRCIGATLFAYGQWGWPDFDFEPGDLAELSEWGQRQ